MRPTDDRGRECLDFATMTDCTQIVEQTTYIAGGRLNLVQTDVPDLMKVSTHCLFGTSNHSHLQVVVTLNEEVLPESNFFAALCILFAMFRPFCDIIADM